MVERAHRARRPNEIGTTRRVHDRHPGEVEKGDRVQLIATPDPWTRLEAGALGTVTLIDSVGTVHVDWDSGSRLGLVIGEDQFRILTREKKGKP